MAPRAYVALLDRWQDVGAELTRRHERCERCGQHCGDWRNWFEWRASSSSGYTTLCPTCTASQFRPYKDHLHGRTYEAVKRLSRADGYLCCLCAQPRRAYYWDHCHDHTFVRGPVCAGCNTLEGHGMQFANRPGAMAHLLRCPTCRSNRTIAERHQAQLLMSKLVSSERHGTCDAPPPSSPSPSAHVAQPAASCAARPMRSDGKGG
ncbi:endonuclease domain-containing protein [Streptomyces sp. NPDC055134]